LRVATTDDAPRIIELVNAAFAVEDFLEGTRTDPERLAANMQKGSILVAEEEGGRLAASVYFEIRGSRGYLGMLAVEPARQGTGLASLLIREAENRMRAAGCEAVDITVLSLRPELLPIYRRFGFVETGTEEFAYGRVFREPMDCHCITMSKPL
jgi:predicted N-acetyltransferase YhbS